jgi:DNA-binding NtrC family response regulator
MPESLVEAELFGSRRGAFTGAKDNRPGLIRSSNGGTLFLDEVGDLALQSQAALLRVLQEREVMAVGATRAEAVDLRVMAATHRDLEALACEARFRNDLLARLSGFIIRLPALRERMEDFGLLTAGLLAQHGTAETTISPEAMRLLLRYDWPLNIRELEHGLRAALALSPARIEPVGLPGSLREGDLNPRRFVSPEQAETIQTWTPEQLARRQQLCTLLSAHRGNISAVARELDKERIQIRRWIKQLAISSDEIESR